jgi:hypothetical protein
MGEPQMPAEVSTLIHAVDWFRFGSCRRSTLGYDAWFPLTKDPKEAEPAKQVCAECPVRSRCVTESLKYPDMKGIWGGLDELDRRRLQMAAS